MTTLLGIPRRTALLTLLGAGLFAARSLAQLPLTPGDLAIVGINANNGGCSGVSAEDEISFICFKDLPNGATLFITDNGYEKQNAGLWGDNEGVIRIQKTAGASILKGTVITIRCPGTGLPTVTYPGTAQGQTWNVLSLNGAAALNMNSGGDQIFFLYPGVGANYSPGTAATNDGFFTNCTLLYAFNTKPAWNAFVNSTQESGLPPGSVCFSMNPTAATDFVKFTDLVAGGTFLTRSQRTWIIDIDNSANWSTYANCTAYNGATPNYAAGYTFPITAATFTNGLWTGAKSQDWFDCRNWDDAEVPTVSSNVVINQTRIQDCQVGINTLTPLTAQCATLTVSSNSAVSPQLAINNGRQLVVTAAANVTRTAAGLNMGITVNSGSFTAGSLTLTGSAAGAANALFRNQVAANTVQVNGDVLISNGGRLDLTNGGLNLTGNFRSMDATSGTSAFLEGNSLVLFNGAGPQAIQTNGFQEIFSTLRVSKSGGDLSLSAPALVNVNLDLVQGRVLTDATNLLSLAAAATATNASNASFVSGPLRKFGTADFTFPVGKSTYHRPASLTNIAGVAADAFTAEYFLTPTPATPWVLTTFPGALDPTLDHISDCEYWQIDRAVGAADATVTLSWDFATSCGVTLLSDLRVARYDGAVWRDRGNGGTTGNLLAGTVATSAVQTQFSPWTLASVSAQNPLPIELMYFLAAADGSRVKLDWATASERDNAHFTVERSADGLSWEPVLERAGAGNSSTTIHYTDHDAFPLPGLSYYRLRQTDVDGASTLSDVRTVTFEGGTQELVVLYGPEGLVALHDLGAEATFEVLDLTGRLLARGVTAQPGRFDVPVQGLAAGTYVLRLSDGAHTRTTTFVR